jgi:hypothetical protein
MCPAVLLVYCDSIIFVSGTAVLSNGFGVDSSESMCSKAILLCLGCYLTTKVRTHPLIVMQLLTFDRWYVLTHSLRVRTKSDRSAHLLLSCRESCKSFIPSSGRISIDHVSTSSEEAQSLDPGIVSTYSTLLACSVSPPQPRNIQLPDYSSSILRRHRLKLLLVSIFKMKFLIFRC